MPPSAITVCALPSRLRQMSAVRAPASWAAIGGPQAGPASPDHDDVV